MKTLPHSHHPAHLPHRADQKRTLRQAWSVAHRTTLLAITLVHGPAALAQSSFALGPLELDLKTDIPNHSYLDPDYVFGESSTPTGASASAHYPGGTSSATGNYVPGHVQVSVTGAGAGNFAGSFARATVIENLILSSPTLADGTYCRMRYSFFVSPGDINAQASGDGTGGAFVEFLLGSHNGVVSSTDGGGFFSKVANAGGPVWSDSDHDNYPSNGVISYETFAPIGGSFSISFNLWTQGSAGGGNNTGSGSYSTSANAYWNGVLELTTWDGVPVSDFTLLNDTGVDFANSFAPVPEPEHYAAFSGASLLAFALWRRGQKRA